MFNKDINHCLICGESLYHDLTVGQLFSFKPLTFNCLCKLCQKQFIAFNLSELACYSCGRNLIEDDTNKYTKAYTRLIEEESHSYCYDCYRWLDNYPHYYLKHQAVLEYNDTIREYLYLFKYRGDYRLSQVVSKFLHSFYQQYSQYQWLILPSSPQTLKERGFHAIEALLKSAEIPFEMPFVYVGDGIRQASKDRKARMTLKQPFQVDLNQFKRLLRDTNKFLVFDDVYTTGATLIHAKDSLYKASLRLEIPIQPILSASLARDNLQ